jgi:AraC-like DNA-binding protein
MHNDNNKDCLFLSDIAYYGMLNAPDIKHAIFLSCGSVTPNPLWHTPPSRHTHHELIMVIGGGITVKSPTGQLFGTEGDVLLYPAAVVHEEWSDPKHPLRSIFLSFSCPGLNDMPVTRITPRRDWIREMAAWLHADRDASSPAARAQRDALLQVILSECLRNTGPEDQPMVTRVRQHIRSHIAEPLSLERLAGVCELSKFHFLRKYRAATGRSPMEDVRAIRAEYARELILSTSLPLKEIAPKAGLGDEYSLSRMFRKLFRTTPGQYRR